MKKYVFCKNKVEGLMEKALLQECVIVQRLRYGRGKAPV